MRPLRLYFWGQSWTLVAWCELREDLRNFRPDRMSWVELQKGRFGVQPGQAHADFLERMRSED